MKRQLNKSAFTLIELIIVISIIAILFIIAEPSYVPAPDRARVSRARADQRSIAVALESYCTDNGAYPAMRPMVDFTTNIRKLAKIGGANLSTIEPGIGESALHGLTTPVAYINALYADPFLHLITKDSISFAYYTDGTGWILISPGPDEDFDIIPRKFYVSTLENPHIPLLPFTYDPTNGTVSDGDVWRVRQ
jgi:prepilin-type N-terminal cleavage/methylation domain-containing protein